jgi:arylsulfatase A-like enzyme
VPLIIAGPGLPHGVVVRQVSGLQDIAPTTLAMTNEWGSQGSFSIDGMSLLPIATAARPCGRSVQVMAGVASAGLVAASLVLGAPASARMW